MRIVDKKTFLLRQEHVDLLSNVWVQWNHVEFGAPTISPKKPYGNSTVYNDIAEILCWELEYDHNGDIKNGKEEELIKIHEDLETALEVVLRAKSFIPGLYEADNYDANWTFIRKV